MSKYHYGPEKYPSGTKVKIKGDRDAHAGQEGEVVRADARHYFWVRIGKEIFRKAGRTFEVLMLSAGQKTIKKPRGNLTEDVRKSYQKMLKDPKFRRTVRGGAW